MNNKVMAEAQIVITKSKHLTPEQIASLRREEEVPIHLVEHLEDCFQCRRELAESLLLGTLIKANEEGAAKEHFSRTRLAEYFSAAYEGYELSADQFLAIDAHLRRCNRCYANYLAVREKLLPVRPVVEREGVVLAAEAPDTSVIHRALERLSAQGMIEVATEVPYVHSQSGGGRPVAGRPEVPPTLVERDSTSVPTSRSATPESGRDDLRQMHDAAQQTLGVLSDQFGSITRQLADAHTSALEAQRAKLRQTVSAMRDRQNKLVAQCRALGDEINELVAAHEKMLALQGEKLAHEQYKAIGQLLRSINDQFSATARTGSDAQSEVVPTQPPKVGG